MRTRQHLAPALCRTPLVLAGLLFAASVAMQPAPPAKATLRMTVPPGAQSPVIIRTTPLASCVVQPTEGRSAKGIVRFFADPTGIARFFVSPERSGRAITRLTVNCEKGSAVSDYDVELRASDAPNAEFPLQPPLPAPVGRARPALSEEEVSRLSDKELIKRGYPLPPDARLSPDGYKLWLRDVTRPAIIVSPGLIQNPYVQHVYGQIQHVAATFQNAPAISKGWSGVMLTGSGGPFAWVAGWWVVPSVTGEPNAQTGSSTWVGIDGSGVPPKDLPQAGTDQDAFGTGSMAVYNYRAWTELLPNQLTESVLTGVPISPGDQVFTEVWIGSAGGGPSLTAASPFMMVCLEDLTARLSACFNYTALAGTPVSGVSAEWIMERPNTCDSQGNNCTKSELANFGNVAVFTTNLMARRSNSKPHQGYSGCCGAGSLLINITSDGTPNGRTLDTVNLNGGTINFVWSAFH